MLPIVLRRVHLSIANWGQYIEGSALKTLFEFMFSQMTKAKFNSINNFKTFRVMIIVGRVWRWPFELKDISLKNQQTISFSKVTI